MAHRTLTDGEIYFLDNHSDTPLEHTFTFRCNRKNVELWNPVTGKRYALLHTSTTDGRTNVTLRMAPRESCFIVFSEQADTGLPLKNGNTKETLTPIQGDWTVDFPVHEGGPGAVVFPELTDWTVHPDIRIRFYSGTATYHHSFNIDNLSSRKKVLLRFDKIGSVARVILNGKTVGTVWCSPWEIDITPYLKAQDNQLEALLKKELIEIESRQVTIPGPILKVWLKRILAR